MQARGLPLPSEQPSASAAPRLAPTPSSRAVRDGRRIVLVTLKGDGPALRGVQVYLAESLGRWLAERKTDGAGRPYDETKDQDPTLRKFFTRAQVRATNAPRHNPHLASQLTSARLHPRCQNQAIQKFGAA